MAEAGSVAALLGGAAGLFALFGLRELFAAAPALMRWSRLALEPLVRAGREGYLPSRPEYRRLAVALAALALCFGWAALGTTGALAAAVLAPLAARWLLAGRQCRYRRRLEAALPEVANALADSLAAGRSLRGALAEVGGSLEGAAAAEFGLLSREIELGRSTTAAVSALRRRNRSARVDAFCAALLVGRESGGDLAALMRRFAAAAAARDRAERDARSATAQARFTGLLVVAMPLGGLLFAEFAQPGIATSLFGSPLAIVLAALALGMQVIGFLIIRRLARTPL